MRASDLLAAFASGARSPVEAVDDAFERIDAADGMINAMLTLDTDRARADALASEARWRSGAARPVEGVPVVVKDLIDTAGLRTTGGSAMHAARVPNVDADVVARVRAAGAVIVGKTATFELGCGDEHTAFGVVHNPHDLSRTTGGSSSGSAAALAASYVPLALGTDTGGSIRIPSSYCGVVGLKPTLARLPRAGVMELSRTLDMPGPMAANAVDAALLFAAMAETAPAARIALTGLRVGVVRPWFCDLLAPDVSRAFEAALVTLRAAGARVEDTAIEGAQRSPTDSFFITLHEAVQLHAGTERSAFGDRFRDRLYDGDAITTEMYEGAFADRARFIADLDELFRRFDVLVVPGSVSTAPPLDQLDQPVNGVPRTWGEVNARTMAMWNVTGLPSLCLPIGRGDDDLPIGMQIVSPLGHDERSLGVAMALEERLS
jgi:aspartyl-tRNA(Asn)/glutamyl-tRNA(Gln) amidotransferase subunit A